ncbi:MAG: ATP-dependent DNA helicase, partial [Desulfobacterales bacterium]|nr:ATP-dependent DNA helicase [Desulfobacterales bacterium]
DYTFLVDEAHNLVDRSREMFSASIQKKAVLETRRAVGEALPKAHQSLSKINTWLLKAGKAFEDKEPWRWEAEPPDDLYPHVRGFLRTAERWLARNIKTPFRETLLDLYFTLNGFMKVAEQYDETYATCYERDGKDLMVKLFCIDPSNQMEEALKRCGAAIFFSATLTPAVYFKKILGCAADIKELNLPSPFPAENLSLYIADRISTLFRHRDRTRDQVARAILHLVRQKRGNYLLFFPSYKYMEMVNESFSLENPDEEIETLVQTPGMTEPERDAFLKRFTDENKGTLVGFVVMGGIFGEGIDLVGDRLSGAVIVGVGLPGLSPERELIREYFTRREGVGFEFAYQYPGFNRVLQAAGRVIRSESDRGVVMLIDARFGERRYRSLFPGFWRPRRLESPGRLRGNLQRFWSEGE